MSISDIEQAGLGKGTSQRLAHNDPRNHGSRFGWLFGAAVPQKTDKSSLAANDNVNKLAAIQSDQNASDTASEADDIDEKTAAANALKVSKDKELWFICGLGIFIVATIVLALVGIKYARSCLLGEKGSSSGKVAPRQGPPRQAGGPGYGAMPAYPPG